MTVFSRPIGAALDSTGPTVVLNAPPGGIPAGSVICVFTFADAVFSVADTPGNVYKTANGQVQGVYLWYAYNTKALRPGDTITVQKYGTGLAKACAFTGLVSSKDPLISSGLYGGFNTKPVTPVPVGDLIVMGLQFSGYSASSHYIEDTAHAWNQYDFARFITDPNVYIDEVFGATLMPRPAGTYNWAPQVIPTTNNGWVTIAAAFAALATTSMMAIGITTASPVMPTLSTTPLGKVVPLGITTASPVIGVPSTTIDAPQVVCLTHRDEPEIMEALHTNLNVAFVLELQPHSLVGRSDDGVGPAQRITVVSPLLLVDKTLVIDPTFKEDEITEITARLAAVEAEAAAATAGIANLADIVSALHDVVSTLVDQVALLQTQVDFIGDAISIGGGAINLVTARPTIGSPHL
jgi:hypothetical protein